MVINSRRMRWAGHVSCINVMENASKILVGNPEGNGPLGRPSHRWENNSRLNLREIGGEDVDWIHLAQDRDQWWAGVNTVVNIQVPKKVGNFLTS
jgi:hypothetical protein